MKYSITTYIVIALVSFLVLTLVQFYLVYNTYELKNERYYYSEKEALLKDYSASVMNDVLFEGGQRIFNAVLNAHVIRLRELYQSNRLQFNSAKQLIADSLFESLARQQSIPSLLSRFRKTNKISDSLEYSLMIESLEINIGDNIHVNLYNKNPQEPYGMRIGGTLRQLDNQNTIVKLTIGSSSELISKLIYSLHVEPVNRKQTIIGQMALTLVLSTLSVFFLLLLFFITFRNWINQKKLSEMKSDFINNITHEFHTPLSAIYVANKSLQNEKIIEKKENIRALTEVIQRQSERLQTLIGQVLDIVSTNKMKLNKKEHSVNNLLDDILLDYRLNVTDKHVNMLFEEKAATDRIPLDPFHFTTMVNNLLDNAVKYNDHAVKAITVSTRADNDQLQLIIKDNGAGMKPEAMKHIFDKFYRGVNGATHPTKGLGLGLYYVRQSAEAHKWRVLVDSTYGEGSTFTIVIPFQNQVV
jgi:two-component system phosphate regulon sensor histidine kinase PhoR